MLTWKYMPDAWTASELYRVDRLPSMAFAGTSPPVELVLVLATQPVSGRAVSAADAGELIDWIAMGARLSPVAKATNAQLASLARLRCRTKLPILLMVVWNSLRC
jgi:hypothetical protein